MKDKLCNNCRTLFCLFQGARIEWVWAKGPESQEAQGKYGDYSIHCSSRQPHWQLDW